MRDFWIWLLLSVPSAAVAYAVHQLMELYLKETLVVAIAAGPGTAYLLFILFRNARKRAAEESAPLTAEQLFALKRLESNDKARRRRDHFEFWGSEPGCLVLIGGLVLVAGLGGFLLILIDLFFQGGAEVPFPDDVPKA